MNVLRRILYITLAFAILTGVAVEFFPSLYLIDYVGTVLGIGLAGIVALTTLSFMKDGDMTMHDKSVLMNGFLIAILVPSLYTAGAFVHQGQTSWSGGEIHWHADFEVLAADEQTGKIEELNLIDPSKFCEGEIMCSLNDRTGSTPYHEHNDDRIHLEGVFKTREDATLSAFFETFGGKLTNKLLVYPTNNGIVRKEEQGAKYLKIAVQKGVGGSRHWCLISDRVPPKYVCQTWDTKEPANSPSEYVISPYKRGASLDDVFIIYDTTKPLDTLKDLQEDGEYKGYGLSKAGEGF